jgi:hypothetical protein
MKTRNGGTIMDQATNSLLLEDFWKRVRWWARRRGYVYIPSYGIAKGVTPEGMGVECIAPT